MKTKSIILIAISLGFGLVAAIGMTQVMGRSKNVPTAPKIKEIQVLVAKNDLEINQIVQPEDVMLQSYRPNQVPERVAGSPEDIKDKRAISRVKKGSFIYLDDLIEKTKYQDNKIPKGYSVQAIKASLESTLYNTLKPGDRIDIIAVLRKPGSNTAIATTFLKNIRVFAVNDQTRRNDASEEKNNIKVVSLLLRPRQAEQLTLAQSMGRLQIVQRAVEESAVDVGDDSEDAIQEDDGSGASLADLFGLGGQTDPETEKKQIELIHQMAASDPQPVENLEKPFEMTIITASGPVQYVWTDRTSLPVRKGSEEAKPAAAAPAAPQTFAPEAPPEGEGVDGEDYNDSTESLDRADASSSAKENESD